MSMPAVQLVFTAIFIASFIGALALIVITFGRISRPPDKTPFASTSVRIAAFGIDFFIIFLINDIIGLIAIPFTYSILGSLNDLGYFISLPFFISSGLFSYLFYFAYLGMWSSLFYYGNMFLLVLFGFVYFLFVDGILGGTSIGKKVMRIKSVTRIGRKPLTIKEGVINALGKSFLLLFDLIIGVILRIVGKRDPKQKQIRTTQQIADILVVNTRYVGETDSDVLEPSDGDKDEIW